MESSIKSGIIDSEFKILVTTLRFLNSPFFPLIKLLKKNNEFKEALISYALNLENLLKLLRELIVSSGKLFN